jgi:hypothetical protein
MGPQFQIHFTAERVELTEPSQLNLLAMISPFGHVYDAFQARE